jgi:hypothetical protein
MDSIRSGRRGGKLLVEDSLTLDLAWIMRLGPIREGQAGSGEIKWSRDGEPVTSAQFRLDLRNAETARLILHYNVAEQNGSAKLLRQTIALTALPQHFGGHRWWLRCQVTGERVRTLYLPPGGERFASRKAWGLGYRVERLNRFDRPFEKLFRAQRRLGNAQGLGSELARPKGMWRRTYARHAEHFEALDIACTEKIATLIEIGAGAPS